MNDEAAALRPKTRRATHSPRLPDRPPDRTWGGSGVGADCAICGAPVKPDQLEFELEFARDGDRPGLDQFHVHIPCFQQWDLERHQQARRTNGSHELGGLPAAPGGSKLSARGGAKVQPERS
jgi:hypothetical protein